MLRSRALACLLGLVTLSLAACAGAPERSAPPRLFAFQSHFWVNLHHFLRAEARRRERAAAPVQPPEELTPGEREAWVRALDAYRPLATRNLLFDADLVRIHVVLSAADGDAPLPAGSIDAALAPALDDAAPIFRARLWPARARANEEWIERTRPLVERLAPSVTRALAAALELDWPALPILVDVTPETGPDLAYTTSSAPAGFAGLATINPSVAGGSAAAVECVFHEALHVLDAQLVRWIEEEGARQSRAPAPELWHALLFYTAGELTRRALGESGTYRVDLARDFDGLLAPLDESWGPYLDGTLSRAAAVRALVRSTAP